MIREVIVTTPGTGGQTHIAPMGIREEQGCIVIAPFRPSGTLTNLLRDGCAVVNCIDDVLIIAGCLTGRRDWPLVAADKIPAKRLAQALSHTELELIRTEDHALRPRLFCRAVLQQTHAAYLGFNRAQHAVLEAAILVSRLHLLPAEKIDHDLDYLRIAVDKTAGPNEREAWNWLMEAVRHYRAQATIGQSE